MISFHITKLEDKEWMEQLIKKENSRSADFNFSSFYLWKDSFHILVAQYQERLIAKISSDKGTCYFFPAGTGDLKTVIEAMIEDAANQHGEKLCIWGITAERIAALEQLFPGKFQFKPMTPSFDYVYSVQKLSSLSGRQLHGKRNHINRFEEKNNWVFEPITATNLVECKEMNKQWAEENFRLYGKTYPEEQKALKRLFDHFERLKMDGGLLRSDGEVVAFTIGEKQNSDTYTVHFEKAFSKIQGAYPMINREFAKYVRKMYPEVVYINREDDMGKENLRRAKRSYYPEFMVEKYRAILK